MQKMENEVIQKLQSKFKEYDVEIKEEFNFTSDILIKIDENQKINKCLVQEIH